MQDQNQDQQDTGAVAPEFEYVAELVRGRIYTFKGIRFSKGEPKPVSRAVKERLEKKAFDQVTINNGDGQIETEQRAKFRFSKIGEPEQKAPRARKSA